MINTSVVFLFITILCFALSSRLEKSHVGFNIFISLIVPLIAFVVGPNAIGVVSSDASQSLDLLISLGLGIVGFILGIQFKKIKSGFSSGVLAFLPKYLLVFLGLTGLLLFSSGHLGIDLPEKDNFSLPLVFGEFYLEIFGNYELLWIALLLGLASITTSFIIDRSYLESYNISKNLRLRIFQLKSLSSYLAIIFLGIILTSFRGVSSAEQLGIPILLWVSISMGSGVFCGLVFSMFLGKSESSERIYLATVGAILFACGVGHSLGISALFVNFIFGITIAMTSGISHLIEKAISRLLYPSYILILFMAGLNFTIDSGVFFAFIPIYVISRYFLMGIFVNNHSSSLLVKENPFNKKISRLLFSQDLFPLALALSYYKSNKEWGSIILSILLPATLINLLIGYFLARRYLVDSSESSLGIDVTLKGKGERA